MSDCYNNSAVAGCYTGGASPQSVVIHYTYDNAGAPAVHITDLAGAPIAGATALNTSVGTCALAPATVEQNELCDVQADGSSVQFIRRTITTFDASGVPTVTVADFELDYVTAYTVTGDVGNCPTCAELAARGLQTAW